MRKTPIILCLLFILFSPLNSLGALKNVTVTWTMSDTTGITGYKMYYAYDSSMAGKLLACEDNSSPALTSLTCTDVDLQKSPVYLAIAAVTTSGERASTVAAQTFTETSTISIVQDFQIENSPAVTTPPSTLDYKINFQPADAPVPTDYVVDSGEVFSESHGYGWSGGTNSSQVRDTDNPDSLNQAYDTLISVNSYGKWDLVLPNGTYLVKIVLGDADWPDGTSYIQAEGMEIVSGATLTATNKWIETESTVNVTDGRLTLTFTGSTTSKVCFIEVTQQ